jgi:WD40 repeat protein
LITILRIALSNDNSKLAVVYGDKSVKVFELSSSFLLKSTLIGHRDEITSIIFNRDGTKIITGSKDKTVRV